jgi:hypothetical protein
MRGRLELSDAHEKKDYRRSDLGFIGLQHAFFMGSRRTGGDTGSWLYRKTTLLLSANSIIRVLVPCDRKTSMRRRASMLLEASVWKLPCASGGECDLTA